MRVLRVSEVGERFIFRHTSRAFDLDFHGLVRVRLVDAAARDIEAVSRQIGVQPDESHERDADIIVNHLPHDIELPADAWMVGAESAADSEHLFTRKAPTDGWSRIRFRPDHCIEIDRSQKSGRIDLLTQMLAHVARRHDHLAIHASGFVWRDKAILVMGWSKGGKTELILPFMEDGATFIGDEWMFVAADGSRMIGLQEPIRIWDWHLTDLGGLRARLPSRSRRRLQFTARAEQAFRGMSRLPVGAQQSAQKFAALVNRQRYVQLRPEVLWPGQCGQDVPIDRVILTVSHPGSDVTLTDLDPADVAARMAVSNVEEMRPLALKLAEMRYRNPAMFLPDLLDVDGETRRLTSALAGVPSMLLKHPYPAPTRTMFERLEVAL